MTTQIRDANGIIRTKADLADNLQYGSAGVLVSDSSQYINRFAAVRNLGRFTEAVGTWAYYTGSAVTKTGNSKKALIDGLLINMDEVQIGASTNLDIRFSSAGMTPFVVGKRYLVSFYAWSATDQQFHMGGVFKSRYLRANQLTRVWSIGTATSTSLLDIGSGTGLNPVIGMSLAGIAFTFYVGGVQISGVPSSYKDGIAQIGDSTMAGASGKVDLAKDFRIIDNREVSTVLAMILRCTVYNRAVGGETMASMDGRWATDITPLAANCREVHIQGGINDIAQGRSLADMQASMSSMVAKAVADKLEYKIYTCTPTDTIGADPVKEAKRKSFNDWIKAVYGDKVFDISSVVEDPENPGYLMTEFWGDGTHYAGNAKTSIARYIASFEDRFSWLRQPPIYQPVYA